MKHTFLTLLAMATLTAVFSQTPRFTVVGNVKKVMTWNGKNPKEDVGYLVDWDYRTRIKIVPTENGATVLMESWRDDIPILNIISSNRRDLEIGIYTYDFGNDGHWEAFVVYSPKPGESHMKVYHNITDERPWLIGNFKGLDKFILNGNLVSVPYHYYYEEHALMHHYVYYDRDFYNTVRHDPDEEAKTDK